VIASHKDGEKGRGPHLYLHWVGLEFELSLGQRCGVLQDLVLVRLIQDISLLHPDNGFRPRTPGIVRQEIGPFLTRASRSHNHPTPHATKGIHG
jgi:hypothetical protein